MGATVVTSDSRNFVETACDWYSTGVDVHNIELTIGRGGQMCRSAGTSAQVMAKDGDYVLLKLPSGELRQVHQNCRATIGRVGNIEHSNQNIVKRSRWKGRRPIVAGLL